MAGVKKKTRFKSIEAAEARIRMLERRLKDLDDIAEQYADELRQQKRKSLLLAMLGATGPAFFKFNEAQEAIAYRDAILTLNGLNPDGSPIQK